MNYDREIYAERDRANADYWDAKALLPTERDLTESEETEDERQEREYDRYYRD